jgi:plastocyanin
MQRQDVGLGRPLATAALAGAVVALIAFASVDGFSQGRYVVSQKGREFNPRSITVARGETVVIVNDDLDLRHHAYIDSNKFTFDSGDQEPGTETKLAIPVLGTFEVLCAIHPKMKLVITVR